MLTFMKTKLRNQLNVHLYLGIQMLSQMFFTMKTSFLEQKTKVGKTTKFIMGNDERVTKFLQLPFVSMMIHACLDMVIHESTSNPLLGL